MIVKSVFAGWIAGLCCAAAIAERLPNFVVIFTDDQGYQDVGCFGSPDIQTPNLDQMAKDGVRLTDFYVGASVCTPSRAALLTGRYPARYGMAKGVLYPTDEKGLPPAEKTIAEVLKQKDYATACIGKWHLGHLDRFLPTAQGFDEYYGIPYSNDMWLAPELKVADSLTLTHGMTREKMEQLRGDRKGGKHMVPLMRGNRIVEFPAEQTTLTRRYAEEAVRFIETNQDKPFFLYMTPAMPHIPLFASEAFKGRSKSGIYGDTIEEIDWAVGEVLDCLKRNGLDDKTLVIFTSDNGPWLIQKEHGGCALPLRNGKSTTYEGGMRVPCIMKMTGTLPVSRTCSAPVSTLDLLPTFAAMAGINVEHTVDGVDILPLMCADEQDDRGRETFLYYNKSGQISAVRMGDWKLIFDHPASGDSGWKASRKKAEKGMKPELYNLREDIGEQNNLAAAHPERVEAMLARARKEDHEVRSQ